MARYGQGRIIPEGAQPEAVLPLSLSGLRLEPALVASLGRVGLKDHRLHRRPAARAARRPFSGRRLMQRLDQALGREAEAISPLMPVAELSTERRFAEPIARQEDISQVIAALAAGINRAAGTPGAGPAPLPDPAVPG